jgi:hypothetical protein
MDAVCVVWKQAGRPALRPARSGKHGSCPRRDADFEPDLPDTVAQLRAARRSEEARQAGTNRRKRLVCSRARAPT